MSLSFNQSAAGNLEGDEMRMGGRRYMFAVELKSGSRTEYEWSATEAIVKFKNLPELNEGDFFRHCLVIKRAILGSSAKDNEVNEVSVEVTDPDMDEKVIFPLVQLAKGNNVQASIGLSFPELPDVKAKFVLSEGSGPVHIIGYHFIEHVSNEYQSEAEEDVTEDEDVDHEQMADAIEKVKAVMRAKRRYQTENGNGEIAAKKAKVEAEDGLTSTNGEVEEMDKDDTAPVGSAN